MASAAEQLAANMNFASFQKATELHKRIWFTLIALVVYRLGTYIPIPGINAGSLRSLFSAGRRASWACSTCSRAAPCERMAIFSLNVMPYISASIIVQLMGTVYPPWEKLKKEGGEAGRKTLNQYTRYLAVVLAVFQSASIAIGLQPSKAWSWRHRPGVLHRSTVVALTGGTLFLMWLGEQITSRGVGNGVSLIIFAGIVARLPRTPGPAVDQVQRRPRATTPCSHRDRACVAAILAIVFMERSQRRLLVHYPKRQQGNRMIGGDTSFMPLKINTAGVIPPIFASSLLLLPTTALGFLATANLPLGCSGCPAPSAQLQHGQPLFMVLYALLIIFFSFFYTSVVFNPEETAENLRKYGGFLPGIRPGKRTAEYLDYRADPPDGDRRGYITAVCVAARMVMMAIKANQFALGGTSILIVVTRDHGHGGADPVPPAGAPV
jgi:preprotein translocase subunit SecY